MFAWGAIFDSLAVNGRDSACERGGLVMTEGEGSRPKRRRKGRDAKGRFQPGFSGNPNGRPPTHPEVPKLLNERLVDKLGEKVAKVDADGKARKVSAYDQIIERVVERFIEAIPSSKPKEIMTMLEWMEDRDIFNHMRAKVTDPYEDWFEEKHEEWVASQRIAQAFKKSIQNR